MDGDIYQKMGFKQTRSDLIIIKARMKHKDQELKPL